MAENRKKFALTHLLYAGELWVEVSLLPDGLALQKLEDKKSGYCFMHDSDCETLVPLLTLTARKVDTGKFITVTSISGWNKVSVSQACNVHTFVLVDHQELHAVTVILTALAEEDRIAWTVRVDSKNPDYSLYECDYPALCFYGNDNTKVFFPYGCGEVYSSANPFSSTQNYPSYGASMEYMAFWNMELKRGIYYGLHDPAPTYKKLSFCKEEENPLAMLKASMPLQDINQPGNSQTLEGENIWQLFDGDWYDAALLYQDFFLRHASWKPMMQNGKRADTPEWLRINPHWWRKRMLWDENYVEKLLEVSEDLGLKSPVHLYDWFQIPYDTNYPHYFPAKDTFQPGVKKLQENGIRVMPYINGRLWDTHDKGKEDWQFTSVAKPNCTKNGNGEPFLEVYPTSNLELAIMCPSTALWQEKQKEITDRLFCEYQVDAIYIDQIGAARAYPCEDLNHSHRPGGGTWWVESYRNLLDHIRQNMPEDSFLSTECTSDPYMKNIQAYLSWIWIKNNQVPAFMVVYNRYVSIFGRNYDYASDWQGQNILAAQSLTFGEQMGWIKPEVYKELECKEFYKKCVHCRMKLGSFFYEGRLLRSPVIEDECYIRTTGMKAEAYDGLLEHTATFSEMWKREDGRKLLLLVNASTQETEPTLTISVPDGDYLLQGDLHGEACVKEERLILLLPALSVSWMLI